MRNIHSIHRVLPSLISLTTTFSRIMRYPNRLLLVVLAALLLNACGTKGPLYQPTTPTASSDDSSHAKGEIRA
jgi:predicted small lipoprotein YifL